MDHFSVIISLHKSDNAVWFEQAWRSIVEQSAKPSVVYVTIDGDLTQEIETELSNLKKNDAHIDIVEVRHAGVNSRGILLGMAVEACATELIAIMDADDISHKDRFEKQLAVFSDDERLDVLGSAVEEICPNEPELKTLKSVPCDTEEINSYAKYRNPINNMSVMFKRSAVLAAGNYQHMPNFADYWLWVRMLVNGARFRNISEPLLTVRAGRSMLNRRRGINYAKSEIEFYRQCRNIRFLRGYEAFTVALLRVPLRLIPKALFEQLYRALRKRNNQ